VRSPAKFKREKCACAGKEKITNELKVRGKIMNSCGKVYILSMSYMHIYIHKHTHICMNRSLKQHKFSIPAAARTPLYGGLCTSSYHSHKYIYIYIYIYIKTAQAAYLQQQERLCMWVCVLHLIIRKWYMRGKLTQSLLFSVAHRDVIKLRRVAEDLDDALDFGLFFER
jgi:hypothetical protein